MILENFSEDKILSIIHNIENTAINKDLDYFCLTRDVFQARVDTYVSKNEKFLQSAIIGEIGNNCFDHNFEYDKKYLRGCYFNFDDKDFVIIADFGRGIKSSLAKVVECKDDLDALKIAFTKFISGRAPEQRGNGLKFVAKSIAQNSWSMYFQSGNACCIIDKDGTTFVESKNVVIGCFAILDFKDK